MSDSAPPARSRAITIDPDYASRKGYDADFLGTGAHSVPLPVLPDDLVALAAVNDLATEEPRYLLPYHHYSVVHEQSTTSRVLHRSQHRRHDEHAPEAREGPLVRRSARTRGGADGRGRLPEQPARPGSPRPPPRSGVGELACRSAKLSNDDTFHFTNCSPQHEDFNQNQTTWAGLEDYILENADNRDLKVSVFTGPVLAGDDEEFAGVQLPRQFWKVVVMVKESGELSATAYLLSQEELIAGLEVVPEEFSYGAYKTFQVPVRRIEELTQSVVRDALRRRPARRPRGHRRDGDQALRRDRALAGGVSHVGRDRRVSPAPRTALHAEDDEAAGERGDSAPSATTCRRTNQEKLASTSHAQGPGFMAIGSMQPASDGPTTMPASRSRRW